MAQIRSTYLHRIPYSMIWNNAIFDINNPWKKNFNNFFSKIILNSFINYSNKINIKNWFWTDKFFSNNNFHKKINFMSKFYLRFFYLNNLEKNKILNNSNKGTNLSIQGKTNFFDYNNNYYCLNSYYLQNFIKIKKKKIEDSYYKKPKEKNKFKKYKIDYKFNFNKINDKKIIDYKSLIKENIINQNIFFDIKLLDYNFIIYDKQGLINFFKNNFFHINSKNFLIYTKEITLNVKKEKNEENTSKKEEKKKQKKKKLLKTIMKITAI